MHSRYGWAPSRPLPRVLKSGRFLAPLDPPLSPVRVPGGRGAGGKGAVGAFASWVWPGWLDGGRGCFRRDHQRALLPWSRSPAELGCWARADTLEAPLELASKHRFQGSGCRHSRSAMGRRRALLSPEALPEPHGSASQADGTQSHTLAPRGDLGCSWGPAEDLSPSKEVTPLSPPEPTSLLPRDLRGEQEGG